ALAAHRSRGGRPPQPRAALEALLPPRARRQGRASQGKARGPGSRHHRRAGIADFHVTPPPSAPYRHEALAWRTGVTLVAGVDEAGRGPLAGPVVAGAVIIAADRRIKGLADSKLLTAEQREALFSVILERAVAVGVGIVDHETIDRVNILQATKLAMAEALARLAVPPPLLHAAFAARPDLPAPKKSRGGGAARWAAGAGAPIGDRAPRARLLSEADKNSPECASPRHKGYATPEHLAALDRWG